MQPIISTVATDVARAGRLASIGQRSRSLAFLPLLALLALVPAGAQAKPQMIQLGLYQKAGVAWWAWKSVEQREPDIAKVLVPLVSPLDAKKPDADVALRAVVPGDVSISALCRRMISAGLGCLEIEAPAATVAVETLPLAEPAAPAPSAPAAVPPPPAIAPSPAPAAFPPAPLTVTATRAGSSPLPRVKPAYPPVAVAKAPVATTVVASAALAVPAPVPATPVQPAATTVPPAPAPAANPAQPPAAQAPAAPVPAAQTGATTAQPPAPGQPAAPLTMASTDPAQINIPAMVLSGILPGMATDGMVQYRADEARSMSEVERRSRRQGRLGAVLPGGGKFEVTPAVLTRSGINYCALTLDDGPHRTVTRRILDVLATENVKVTYFPIGKPAEVNGPIIHDFVAAGHEVGNHSLTHADLRAASPEVQRHEIDETNRILRGFGANPVLFRPPYGRYNESLLKIAHELGMSTVLWNVDTRDWQVRDPDKIVQYVQTSAGTGSVLLLHSTYPTTASALPRVISDLRAKGCQFVTLSQWIERMRQLAEPPVMASGAAAP